MKLCDQIYLEQIKGQEVNLRFHNQTIVQIKYIESIDRWIIATDKNIYVYTKPEMEEQIKDLKSLNWTPSYYTLTREKAKKKADVIADVILGKVQLSDSSYNPVKLENIKKVILELP